MNLGTAGLIQTISSWKHSSCCIVVWFIQILPTFTSSHLAIALWSGPACRIVSFGKLQNLILMSERLTGMSFQTPITLFEGYWILDLDQSCSGGLKGKQSTCLYSWTVNSSARVVEEVLDHYWNPLLWIQANYSFNAPQRTKLESHLSDL